jgi:RNA polymerase sigma factor (TIGR02999 family)
MQWANGDERALGKLVPLVYEELRRIAHRHLRQENRHHTLQTTALVHEAYVRLSEQKSLNFESRAQFFALAAEIMRHILVDYARSRRAAKRGGGAYKVSITSVEIPQAEPQLDVLALDDALTNLARLDRRQSRIIEMRFFAGLSIEEISQILGLSPATIKREWTSARAWLHRELSKGTDS